MAISEESRYEMHQRFDEVFGVTVANTVMSHLPPVGWADVATKRDLDHLERVTNLRFDQVDARFGRVDARFDAFESSIEARFEKLESSIEARFDMFEARVEARLQQGLRTNLMATVGAVGLLLALFEFIGR